VGDSKLFEAQVSRSNLARVNFITCLLAPILVLSAGVDACAIYIFADKFALAVIIIVLLAYLWDFLFFRPLFIFFLSLIKCCQGRKYLASRKNSVGQVAKEGSRAQCRTSMRKGGFMKDGNGKDKSLAKDGEGNSDTQNDTKLKESDFALPNIHKKPANIEEFKNLPD
jgi:hypothetical protein